MHNVHAHVHNAPSDQFLRPNVKTVKEKIYLPWLCITLFNIVVNTISNSSNKQTRGGGFRICAIKSAQHETYAVKLRQDIESREDVEKMHCCIASLLCTAGNSMTHNCTSTTFFA